MNNNNNNNNKNNKIKKKKFPIPTVSMAFKNLVTA